MARGLTLIETLVVLVLLGMLAGVAAVGLAGASDRARLMDARASMVDLDSKARSASLAGETVCLLVDDRVAKLTTRSDDTMLASRTIASNIEARLLDADGIVLLKDIRFDSRGHTNDYRLVLNMKNQRESGRAWSVSGLTGWSEPVP